VYVEGDMIDGRSRRVPLLDAEVAGSYTIADALRAARENPLIRAVVLRVETPGGSSTAADVIWRQVQLTVKVKPVVVSMGGYAASGGYYISAPGTRIFANPSSLTGSIGVFYGKADASQLLDRIGVDVEVYKTAERADADAMYRPFTEGERTQLERNLAQFYNMFLERVAEGRKLDKGDVDRVARGRVWTGEQAREKGLVDEVGGLRQALGYARQLAQLPDDAPIIELPRLPSSLLGRLLGVPGLHDSAQAQLQLRDVLPPSLIDLGSALAPFLMYPSHLPLMRLEYVLSPP
jgi:protease-4